MIGDLITFKDCQQDEHPTIIEIVGLGYQGRGVESEALVSIDGDKGCDLVEIDDEFVGIPLTPERLEKIGFKNVSNHTLQGCETYQLSFGKYNDQRLIYKLGDYFAYESYDDRWYRLFETQLCHKWCIHDLQHALKLCGIKIEVTL